jgi:hypothetical protein
VSTLASDPYTAAVEYARKRGAADGANAAGWYVQETIGGRVTGDPVAAARYILRGIEDGDSAVTDGFPFADLSGEWADSLTGTALYDAAIVNADDWTMTRPDWVAYWAGHDAFSDVCDAYSDAFSSAAEDAIASAARAILA